MPEIFMTYLTHQANCLKTTQLSILLLLLMHSGSAYAYLDPGTGSMILQGIIAGLAIAGVTLRHYWYRITSFFGRGKKQANLLEDDEENQRDSDN